MTRVLTLLALALAPTGCGADREDGGAPPPAADDETRLEITVWPEGTGVGEPRRYLLTCNPPGGGHPDPEAACEALEKLGAGAFEPVPEDVVCTQVYGGPQEAQASGVVRGEPVEATLAYTDGCEIARWDRVAEVVPRPDV